MKTILTMEVEHYKIIPELWDLVAGRAYTVDGVSNVTATLPTETVPERVVVMSLEIPLAKLSPEQVEALKVFVRLL